MLNCHIVQDLLPSYMEELLSPETKAEMDAHLAECEACRAVRDAMAADIPAEKAPASHRDFLRRINRRRIAGAVISAVAALACAIGLYCMEFSVDVTDTGRLEAAIEEYNQGRLDADVVETVKIGKYLYALYLRTDDPGGHGIAKLERGMLGRYRFHHTNLSQWPLYAGRTEEIRGREYLLLYGKYDLPGVASYKAVDYMGKVLYEGEAETAPFLRLVELEESAEFFPMDVAVYYDAEGREVDESELYHALSNATSSQSSSVSSAEMGMVYVFMAIVLAVGCLLIRYFLLP